MSEQFDLVKRLSPKLIDAEQLSSSLATLAETGNSRLAEQYAKDYINTVANFITGLYHSGRIMDENGGKALFYANMAVSVKPTIENYSNLLCLYNKHDDKPMAFRIWGFAKDLAESSDPKAADLWYNYACLLTEVGRLQEAAKAYRRSMDINPDCPATHTQLAAVLMASGDFAGGLREDQWRFKSISHLVRFRKRFPAPDWDGSKNQRVLVFSEKGVGDAILHARYLSYMKDLGCKVVLEIQTELVELFKRQPHLADEVYGRVGNDFQSQVVPTDAYDSVVSINSLPFWLDKEYTMEPFGAYLNVPDVPMEHKRPRIGLVWAGNAQAYHDETRSCFLKDLAPLWKVGVLFLNFQKGKMERCWTKGFGRILDPECDFSVVNLVEGAEILLSTMPDVVADCNDFYDTALRLKQLDLLITVDTSMVHLAGALGVPTWLLVKQDKHAWYWLKEWYTSVKYYKGDWAALANKVAIDLKKFVLTDCRNNDIISS